MILPGTERDVPERFPALGEQGEAALETARALTDTGGDSLA
jgi:hypothetical protein